jgi:hypothetical protein
MKKLMLFFMALIALPFLCNAMVVVGMNVDIMMDDPTITPANAANDFHVSGVILSANGTLPMVSEVWVNGDPRSGTWKPTGYSVAQDVIDPTKFYFTVDFKTNGSIYYFPGNLMWLHFGITILVDDKNVMVNVNGYWTRNGVRIGGLVPLTGFIVGGELMRGQSADAKVREASGQYLQIWNHSEVPLEVSVMELAVSSERVPLEDMFHDGLGEPGQVGSGEYSSLNWISIPKEMMPPLMHEQFFEIPLEMFGITLEEGQFLLMRGHFDRFTFKSTEKGPRSGLSFPRSVTTNTFWHQHEQ